MGVTRTLVESNLIDDEFFNDRARGRGKLVHFFCERIIMNRLGPYEIPESAAGYLVGLRRFLDKYAPKVKATEIIDANFARLFAGGIDIDCDELLGGPAVVEIKTGSPTPWHGLQTAPYAYLLDGPKWMNRGRFGLYLTETGGHRLKQYDSKDDLDRFFGALDNLHWRIRHGSFERPYGRRVAVGYGSGTTDGDPIADDGLAGDRRDGFDLDPAF